LAGSGKEEQEVNASRTTATIAGALFIVATAASLISSGLTGSSLDAPDYLAQLSANGNRVVAGGVFTLIAAATSSGIAICLYPVLKKHNEGLALGAVGFRLIEGVFYIVGVGCLISLLTLSREFVNTGAQDGSHFQTLGVLLLTAHDLANYVFAVFAFCLGALMYYFVFYQSGLVPGWLSVWGLVAIVLLLSAAFVALFRGPPYSISGELVILILPLAVQEMALAVWLIVKGFNPSAVVTETTQLVATR
jgi:hypothetical protein